MYSSLLSPFRPLFTPCHAPSSSGRSIPCAKTAHTPFQERPNFKESHPRSPSTSLRPSKRPTRSTLAIINKYVTGYKHLECVSIALTLSLLSLCCADVLPTPLHHFLSIHRLLNSIQCTYSRLIRFSCRWSWQWRTISSSNWPSSAGPRER